MKSVKMFGKSVPLLAILMISMLTIGASAALLEYYGSVVATATVYQSVSIDGNVWNVEVVDTFETTGGRTVTCTHIIHNAADIDAVVQFVVTSADDGVTVSFPEWVNPDGTLQIHGRLFDFDSNNVPDYPNGQSLSIKFCYTFDIALEPDTYTITIEVRPVSP